MTKYNPMSKEFKEEANRLGLTGNQLTAKYRKEEKYIEKYIYKDGRSKPRNRNHYTDEQLLDYPAQFVSEYGKIPTKEDFNNNPGYPSGIICAKRFGSWSYYLKLVGLDVESMIKKGVLENKYQKGRLGEVIVRDHFKVHSVDLAGENNKSSCDGICPNGKIYEVKSSKFYKKGYWSFCTNNKFKEEIEIYYFLAFNEDWTKLEYGWRIPGEIVEEDSFYIGLNSWSRAKFTVGNMKKYDVTDELRYILREYVLKK